MNKSHLRFLLIMSQIVEIKIFIIITGLLFIGLFNKKVRKYIISLYLVYFFGVFIIFFPINKYGTDMIALYFLKKKLVPESFIYFKENVNSKKETKDKILFAYPFYYELKFFIKQSEKEYKLMAKELENTKGIEKNFILINETENII